MDKRTFSTGKGETERTRALLEKENKEGDAADIPSGLLNDDVVCFIADRYHTSPKKVVECFLIQDGIVSEAKGDFLSFSLEDNKMEILRGLVYGNHLSDFTDYE